jgi:RND family efflux transporter MFP subunit
MRSPLLLLLIIGLLFTACKQKVEVQEEILRPVRYTIVASGTSISSSEFSGVTQSANQSNLSFRVSGNIIGLNAKEGQTVKKGQLLATLDAIDYKVQLEQSQANLKQAEVSYQGVESQVAVALSNYKRVESLYENNSVSLSEFEQAKNNYENAKAQLEAAQAQIAAARAAANAAGNQVSYTYLNAPYDGIIQQVSVDLNERVMAGKTLMIINGEGKNEVAVGIPESFINEVNKEMAASVTFPALRNIELPGTVSEIGFDPNNASTYPVTISINREDGRIKPGMAARVKFSFDRAATGDMADHPVVPARAIGEDHIGHFVFLLEEQDDGSALVARQDISIGELTEDGFEITEGLDNGDLIATAGMKTLLDGMKVKLMDPE